MNAPTNAPPVDDAPALEPPSPRLYGILPAIGFFLATRLFVLVVALVAPQHRDRPNTPEWWSDVPLARWDGGHYAEILLRGYPTQINDTVAFFPAYSVVSRPLAWLIGADLAMVTVSHLSSLGAVILIYLWARRHAGARAAFWSIVLLSVYPPAMFLSATYSDAFLLLTVAIVIHLLERARIWPAAIASAVATATRPTGLVVAAIVMLWDFVARSHAPFARRIAHAGAVGLVSIAGLIAFQLHLWQHYGRPDAFFAAQSSWGQKPVDDPVLRLLTLKPVLQPAFRPIKYALRGPFKAMRGDWQDLRSLLEPQVWNPFLNVTIVVIGVYGLLRPGRVPRLLYLLPILVFLEAYLADPLRAGRLVGIARYQLIAIPCFLLVADSRLLRSSRMARYGLVGASLALQCVYVRGFVDWQMVG